MRYQTRRPTLAWPILAIALCCVLPVLILGGCDELNSKNPSGTGQDPDAPKATGPTIVCLSPALTQMLIDMGKRDLIVGVSSTDSQAMGLPDCGTYTDPLVANILEIEPQMVLTESPFEDGAGVAPLLKSYAEQGIFKLGVVTHSRSIADVERALTDTSNGLGKLVGDAEAAERARRLMSARLELVQASVKDAKPPRVLMLIEPSTLGALGPGATHDEMLRLAGGVNAIAGFNSDYLKLTRAQLQAEVRPDVILIFEPSGRSITENDSRLRALEGLNVPAVVKRRVVVIDHPQSMLPSTTLPAVVAQMAKAIHPERSAAIDKAYAMAERVVEKASSGGGAPTGAQP